MRIRSVLFTATVLAAFATGCSSPEKPDPVDDGPFVPNPATWGRNKTRVDEVLAPGKGELKVGVSTRFIDGPVGVSMAGYGGRNKGRKTHWNDKLKGSAGFYGMQSVKAIAVEVGTERMAFVKSPLMSSESYLTDAIARHLKRDHDLDFDGRVITVAGHSHHSTARYWPLPELLGHVGADSFDFEVAETDAAIFAEAIADAWNTREPGEWAHGSMEDWDVGNEVSRDRRNGNNHLYGKDPRLTLMAFRRKADATPLAVVFNFPIHGTVFGDDNDVFTEDAPGIVEHKFEEAFFAREGKPVFGLYAQSAGGDASPAGDALDHPPLARLERLGEAAAPKILAVYDTLQWSSETELAIRSQRIELVHDRLYKGKPWENEFFDEEGKPYTWGGWQCVKDNNKATMEGEPKLCVDIEMLLGLLEVEMPHNAVNQVYLTMARLGDLWMMTMPGEPAYSMVKYIREHGAERTWNGKPAEVMVLGYSQDHFLYLTAPDDWYLGGYESEMSLWGPGGGAFFADESFKVMDQMIAGKNGPHLFAESPSIAPDEAWEPRVREFSVKPGEIVTQPESALARTQTAQFAANCGDPGLGNPRVHVQKKTGENFVNVPALHGWKDRAYDNTRYEMVSIYDPTPKQEKFKSVEERTHLWRFYWQVPSDWATGTYRLQLECNVLKKGTEEAEKLTLNSNAFTVSAAEGTTLAASIADKALTLKMHVPGVEQEMSGSEGNTEKINNGAWISAGYRLLDPTVRHTEAALVRAALKVEVLDADGTTVLETLDAPFVQEAGANVATLANVPAGAWSVRAWLAVDETPAKLTTSMTVNP